MQFVTYPCLDTEELFHVWTNMVGSMEEIKARFTVVPGCPCCHQRYLTQGGAPVRSLIGWEADHSLLVS